MTEDTPASPLRICQPLAEAVAGVALIALMKIQHDALVEARAYVARDLQSTLECVCTLDKTTQEPIESTMDPEEAEHVASIRALLAHIDQVLGDAK